MRTLESLLLLTVAMACLGISVPWMRGRRWTRQLPVFAAPMVIVQCLVEGPRWQLLPAYTLAALFALVWLAQNVVFRRGPADRKRRHPRVIFVARGLGALSLTIAAVLPMLVPVFRFARPSGPYAIGTVTYHWEDLARAEAFGADSSTRRQLMVQVWYPAHANALAQRAAYLPDVDAVTAAFARLLDAPAFLFGHFKYVTTNAMLSVPVAVDHSRYPVLLFLEGATGFRR